MTGWLTSDDIVRKAQALWDKGNVLAVVARSENELGRVVNLKPPSSSEITSHFDDVRKWVADVNSLQNCRVVYTEVNHRLYGRNKLPQSVVFDTVDGIAQFLGRERELDRFRTLVEVTSRRYPQLLPYLEAKPLAVLELDAVWSKLLDVIDWMLLHPRSDLYLRAVDVPGVHTKFIAEHQRILSELFELVLPAEFINKDFAPSTDFERRYGFRTKPVLVRYRLLDEPHRDVTLDSESFGELNPNVQRVFIVENEINFLSFPHVPSSIVIFGSGYGADGLRSASWLLECDVIYWGDIDTHGFAILNGLRKYLPHARSLMMDEATLLHMRSMWGIEAEPHPANYLDRLTVEESEVYAGLKSNRWSINLRIEQEQIDWTYVSDQIQESVATEVMNSGPIYLLDSDLALLFRPSRCDLRVRLMQHHVSEGPRSPFEEFLAEQSAQHLHAHRSLHEPCTNISVLPEAEWHAVTVRAVTMGESVIFRPFLSLRTKLGGREVVISAKADLLLRRDDGTYTVRNVRIARNISIVDHPEHIVQIQLFAFLVGRCCGIAPNGLEILNGANEIFAIPNDGGLAALRELIRVMHAKVEEPKYEPVGVSKCGGCEFERRCFDIARHANDVSMLPGVDQELARTLHARGVASVDALLAQFDAATLASVTRRVGSRLARVGDAASRILAHAHAFVKGEYISLAPPTIPQVSRWAVLDLEGLPPIMERDDVVFLWGLAVYDEGSSEAVWRSFTVARDDVDHQASWQSFLREAQLMLDRFEVDEPIPILHWHNYDATMIRKYADRCGDPDGVAARLLQRCLDLLEVLQSSVALPVSSYSLKVVEKFVGYERSQSGKSGDWAVAQYLRAMGCDDDVRRQNMIDEIVKYNSEDIDSTCAVWLWLRKRRER